MIVSDFFHLGMKKSDRDVQSEKMRQIEKAVAQGNAEIINPSEEFCDDISKAHRPFTFNKIAFHPSSARRFYFLQETTPPPEFTSTVVHQKK